MKAASAPRASVTFPREIYRTLEQIAIQKKVSIAWVVRDAVEQYVSKQQKNLPRKNDLKSRS
jgi:predicted transcriptional regulator